MLKTSLVLPDHFESRFSIRFSRAGVARVLRAKPTVYRLTLNDMAEER
jgi:hypothetical protein